MNTENLEPNGPMISRAGRMEMILEPDSPAVESVRAILRTYNRDAVPDFWRTYTDPATAPQPLVLVVSDGGGAVAGGLLGETFLAWLKVQILAVREDLRRQGLGRTLLQAAEAEAVRRGCAYLDTMDYQAPEFYRRLGYETAGRIPDGDSHGHAKHFLIKRLIP